MAPRDQGPSPHSFTYTVHALRNLLLKNTGIAGIYLDVLVLLGFSAVFISGCIVPFKRQL